MNVSMTPKEITHELDKYIIGQYEAKRAVAIALRNRWRRLQVPKELQEEIKPKNILMIGPTGVGKTEIARRLAKLANAPFIKVEATKFTEVGYVGRDVESIIRELADRAIKMSREQAMSKVRSQAEDAAEDRILDALLPINPRKDNEDDEDDEEEGEKRDNHHESARHESHTRQIFRKKLREHELDDKEIEIDLAEVRVGIEIMGPPGLEEMTNQLQDMFESMRRPNRKTRKMKVKDALRLAIEEEASKRIDKDKIQSEAIRQVEENGIVFIDEMDKITGRGETRGPDVSREGVQRDLLPLIEGCAVTTKYGIIKTDHILFITSGAFHQSKPSDLIAELQGRLPIRVELNALTAKDFICILTETKASLTEQYTALLATEGVIIEFSKEGIQRIAEIAWHVNENTENIGARRLHTVMERLVEVISFDAPDKSGERIVIDDVYVNAQLSKLLENQDLSRYIL